MIDRNKLDWPLNDGMHRIQQQWYKDHTTVSTNNKLVSKIYLICRNSFNFIKVLNLFVICMVGGYKGMLRPRESLRSA